MFNFRNPIKTVVNTTIARGYRNESDVLVLKAVDVTEHTFYLHRGDKMVILYGTSAGCDEILFTEELVTSRSPITEGMFMVIPDGTNTMEAILFSQYDMLGVTMSYRDYCALLRENVPVMPLAS